MATRISLLICVLTIAAAVAGPARATGGNSAREAQDRTEIEKLMWDYARALDTGNADAYAALYTADGAFGKTQGHEALKKMITDLNTSREARRAKGEGVFGTLHMTTDHYIEFTDADHATVHYYWLTSFVPPPTAPGAARPKEPAPPVTGHGIDTLVRIKGHWLIQDRNVTAPDPG